LILNNLAIGNSCDKLFPAVYFNNIGDLI